MSSEVFTVFDVDITKYSAHLDYRGVLVYGDENLVQKGLEVVAENSIHDESLQGWNDHVVFLLNGDVKVHKAASVVVFESQD